MTNKRSDEELVKTPEEEGQEAVSGSEPDPSSDDNVDEMTAKVGLYDNEGDEEVNIAKQIEKDEKGLRDIPPDK